MLEPGTGQALEIPVDIVSFHETELRSYPDAVVAFPFFKSWLGSGGKSPAYDQCVGYKIPLYLGGNDEVTNLEISDFDVYWTLSAQLLTNARDLPAGTKVGRISISDA